MVQARVSGSSLYRVEVKVAAVPKVRWATLCKDCAAGIDSLVELLQGRLSKGVMERICQQKTGLFPSPNEIEFGCSCPDWASMCKHVAAVLYGVGARLDQRPEQLFKLRKVDEKDLIAHAGKALPLSKKGPAADRVLGDAGLSAIFGIEMAESTPPATKRAGKRAAAGSGDGPAASSRTPRLMPPAFEARKPGDGAPRVGGSTPGRAGLKTTRRRR